MYFSFILKGLRSQETLIIQRVDKISTLTQGHGESKSILLFTVNNKYVCLT